MKRWYILLNDLPSTCIEMYLWFYIEYRIVASVLLDRSSLKLLLCLWVQLNFGKSIELQLDFIVLSFAFNMKHWIYRLGRTILIKSGFHLEVSPASLINGQIRLGAKGKLNWINQHHNQLLLSNANLKFKKPVGIQNCKCLGRLLFPDLSKHEKL